MFRYDFTRSKSGTNNHLVRKRTLNHLAKNLGSYRV